MNDIAVDIGNVDHEEQIQRTQSMSKSQKTSLERVIRRLTILMIVNVVVTTLCLGLYYGLSYSGASIDLFVANLGLWLSFKVNEKQFNKLCGVCLKLSK